MLPTRTSLLFLATLVAGCAGEIVQPLGGEGDVGDLASLEPADESVAGVIGAGGTFAAGSLARVCNASALNQRSGPGTSYAVLRSMPDGTTVKVLEQSGVWVRNDWGGRVGWSHSTYLCAVGGGGSGGGAEPAPSFEVTTVSRDSVIAIAKAGVGFSYYWGGGRFATGAPHGACYGSCPSCTHSGSYGADCSGYVAKAWLLPEALPMDANRHPFSTADFHGGSQHWSGITRGSVQRGDALVYRSGGAGHIAIYEKGDAWGSMWLYEARGCSYGVVHNLRSLSSSYKAIKRDGL
jgi:hypothetical protein